MGGIRDMRNIAIIDAQGAGLGQSIIKKIRKDIENDSITLIGLGTNNTATANMIKAGADIGVTGEKRICDFLETENIWAVIGPIGVICNGGINGEITSEISQKIFKLNCKKYIIPLKMHGIYVPGTVDLDIKDMIKEIIDDIKSN